jgi:hypothetical protein
MSQAVVIPTPLRLKAFDFSRYKAERLDTGHYRIRAATSLLL